jgi:hypothetical protein
MYANVRFEDRHGHLSFNVRTLKHTVTPREKRRTVTKRCSPFADTRKGEFLIFALGDRRQKKPNAPG